MKTDDSSGDESESDDSDIEVMEAYDEQLQDDYEMHVIDDSDFDDSSGEEEVDDDESSGEEDEDDEAESNELKRPTTSMGQPPTSRRRLNLGSSPSRVTPTFRMSRSSRTRSTSFCNGKTSEDNFHLCVNGGKIIGTSKFDTKTKRFHVIWEKSVNHLLVDKTFKGGNMGWAMPQGRLVEDFDNDPDKMIVALNTDFEKFHYSFEMGCEPSTITFNFFREDHGDTQLNFLICTATPSSWTP